MATGLGTIRLKGSDKVYLIQGTKHWIKDAETLEALGYKLGEEQWLEADEFAQYEEGEPIEVVDSEPEDRNDDSAKEEMEIPEEPKDDEVIEPVRELWQ